MLNARWIVGLALVALAISPACSDEKSAGKDSGNDSTGVCTPGMNQTCNDSPIASDVAGICQGKGTCTCNPEFVLNPDTGRCLRPEAIACAGSYDACGCGCCTGKTPTPVCYYPGAGDSLGTIKVADEAVKNSATCPAAGCTLGQRYLCCVEAAPEPAGSAQYSAVATMTAIDRISLKKTGLDGNCVSLTLGNPGSLSGTRPMRVTLPAGWGIEAYLAAGACGGGTLEQAIGAQGTVTLVPSGTSCVLSVHMSLYFYATATGVVSTTRLDADNVPISGGLSSVYCP